MRGHSAVPSYMAFEDRLAGFDIKFVAPTTAWITPEPIAILAGPKHVNAARAFIEFMLSERGQRVALERGVFPITPKYHVQGAPGSTAEHRLRPPIAMCALSLYVVNRIAGTRVGGLFG